MKNANSAAAAPHAGPGTYAIDGLIASGLAVLAGVFSLMTFAYLDPVLYGLEGIDFWFQSDMARVFFNMTGADVPHYRTSVHPLFSLAGYFSTKTVLDIFGGFANFGKVQAVQMIIALIAFFWAAALYVLLRLMSLPRLDAAIFSLLGVFSAASIFWFSVPETYSFGSLSIIAPLIVAACSQYRPVSEIWYVFASVASFSFTITNWMSGLFASFVNLGIWKALRVSVLALLIVTLGWYVQKQIFPTSLFFLQDNSELNYLVTEESGGPLRVLISFFSTSIVMPDIELVGKINRPDWQILTVQHSFPWSGGALATAAAACWLLLLGIGIKNLFFGHAPSSRIRLSIGLTLAGQMALHLLYGEETFLYALHYLPLLIASAALAALGRFRRIALILALIVLCVGGLNNLMKFRQAREIMMHHFYPERGREAPSGVFFTPPQSAPRTSDQTAFSAGYSDGTQSPSAGSPPGLSVG